MFQESYRWLAAVIGTHKGGAVVGRTRLQKTVMLLQRLGMPTDYLYTFFFYGPYSEDVVADLRLLERMGLVEEEKRENPEEGKTYSIIRAKREVPLPELERFRPVIKKLEQADAVVLELAATYDAFREIGASHEEGLKRLQGMKEQKCQDGRQEKALALLRELGLRVG